MSGTQIWMGRKPCCRKRLRCALTFSRDDLDGVRAPIFHPHGWLHVTYHNSQPTASDYSCLIADERTPANLKSPDSVASGLEDFFHLGDSGVSEYCILTFFNCQKNPTEKIKIPTLPPKTTANYGARVGH
jgi:hypothetical protein